MVTTFLDTEGAYDAAHIPTLIFYLYSIKIPAHLCKFLSYYMRDTFPLPLAFHISVHLSKVISKQLFEFFII